MPKIGEMEFNGCRLLFWMDGDKFTVIHDGKRYHFEDEELEDKFNKFSYAYDVCFDSGRIGMDAGKPVRIPKVVLQSRDMTRMNREIYRHDSGLMKIGETFEAYGCVEF